MEQQWIPSVGERVRIKRDAVFTDNNAKREQCRYLRDTRAVGRVRRANAPTNGAMVDFNAGDGLTFYISELEPVVTAPSIATQDVIDIILRYMDDGFNKAMLLEYITAMREENTELHTEVDGITNLRDHLRERVAELEAAACNYLRVPVGENRNNLAMLVGEYVPPIMSPGSYREARGVLSEEGSMAEETVFTQIEAQGWGYLIDPREKIDYHGNVAEEGNWYCVGVKEFVVWRTRYPDACFIGTRFGSDLHDLHAFRDFLLALDKPVAAAPPVPVQSMTDVILRGWKLSSDIQTSYDATVVENVIMTLRERNAALEAALKPMAELWQEYVSVLEDKRYAPAFFALWVDDHHDDEALVSLAAAFERDAAVLKHERDDAREG